MELLEVYLTIGRIAGAAIATLVIFGVAQGMGRVVSSAVESIARNPSASGDIQKFAILGMAFTEALGLFALFVVLLILFAV